MPGNHLVLENSQATSVHFYRVFSDMENLEMSGNFDARRKSQGKAREFLKYKKRQGKAREFCYVKFVFNQSEHPNFEKFPGEHAPRPPKQSRTHIRT